MKGRIARRAMELGGFPVFISEDVPRDAFIMTSPSSENNDRCPVCGQEIRWVYFCGPGYEDGPRQTCGCPENSIIPPKLSEIRLVQAMRKIDPEMAAMIESLAPVYLVKG